MQGLTDYNLVKKWNRRNFLIFTAVFVVFVICELMFHFIEVGIGQYLVWQNEGRERVGRSWTDAENQLAAGSSLENYSQKIRQQERDLNNIHTFRELLQALTNKSSMTLPAAHFLRIYSSIPQNLNAVLISPDSLIQYRISGNLENVYTELTENGLRCYFLDNENQFLHVSLVEGSALDMFVKHGNSIVMDIASEARFQSRTFDLSRFQQLIDELPFDMKNNFLRAMPALVQFAGPSTKVAISDEITNNFHEVAIANDNIRAFIYYIPADWVNELIEVLDEQDFDQYEEEFIF